MKISDLQNLSKDDLLDALGLQTKSSGAAMVLPAIGFFGAGILVGVGVGILFAPKSGSEIRDGLRDSLNEGYDRAKSLASDQMSSFSEGTKSKSEGSYGAMSSGSSGSTGTTGSTGSGMSGLGTGRTGQV